MCLQSCPAVLCITDTFVFPISRVTVSYQTSNTLWTKENKEHHSSWGPGYATPKCASTPIFFLTNHLRNGPRISLVVQWLRICLSMQGTQVQCLIWENPTWFGATKLMSCNYWSPCTLEPVLCNKRNHCKKKPPLTATTETVQSKEDTAQQK